MLAVFTAFFVGIGVAMIVVGVGAKWIDRASR